MGDKTAVDGDLRGKGGGRKDERLILPAHYLKLMASVHAESEERARDCSFI